MKKSFKFTILTLFLIIDTSNFLYGYQPQQVEALTAGERVYNVLVRNNLLENYLFDIVDDVVERLIDASDLSTEYQINGPYRPNAINIYLINGEKLSESSLLSEYRISLYKSNVKIALTDEENRIVFLNTELLKCLITCAVMKEKKSTEINRSVAQIVVNGLNAYKHLWDPIQNSSLMIRDYAQTWELMFRGMIGFLIGHELGHIKLGPIEPPAEPPSYIFKGREKDLRWACPELINPFNQHKKEFEKKADAFCADLISKIYFPPGVTPTPRLWYELGAGYLFNYFLANDLIEAIRISKSRNSLKLSRIYFGNKLTKQLLEKISSSHNGVVKTLFTTGHPGSFIRILELKKMLTKCRYSVFYGKLLWNDRMVANEIENLRAEVCAELKKENK